MSEYYAVRDPELEQLTPEEVVNNLVKKQQWMEQLDKDLRGFGEQGLHPEYLLGSWHRMSETVRAFGYVLQEKEETR
jgi:hypothetical protein